MADNNPNPHAEAYGRVVEMLNLARQFAASELDDPALNFIRMTIDADLRRVQQKLNMHGSGVFLDTIIAPIIGTEAQHTAGPVTSILGQPVNFRHPVAVDQTQISDSERQQFLQRRDALIERFATASDAELVAMAQTPNTDKLFRNIARTLGMDDYRDAELNAFYIDRIRVGLKERAEQDAHTKAADALRDTALNVGNYSQPNTNEQQLPGALANLYPDQQTQSAEVTGLPVVEPKTTEELKEQNALSEVKATEQPITLEAPKEETSEATKSSSRAKKS